MAEVAGIADELKQGAERLDVLQAELQGLLMAMPNLPHDSVPRGRRRTGNVEVRRWGTPAQLRLPGARTTSTWAPRWAWTSRPAPS
jgi:seryl-tRNA synthetase